MDREEVSHELRTPLTTIKGVFSLLVDGRIAAVAPDEATRLIYRAWHQIDKLERVVERIEAEFSTALEDHIALVLYEEVVA